ncbi:MAG TPA: hypothetical protein VFL96_00615 [Acidobacteriaceae bacterium]|nr:hypothetical protein [Acidobacteriaceae bacterium]
MKLAFYGMELPNACIECPAPVLAMCQQVDTITLGEGDAECLHAVAEAVQFDIADQ